MSRIAKAIEEDLVGKVVIYSADGEVLGHYPEPEDVYFWGPNTPCEWNLGLDKPKLKPACDFPLSIEGKWISDDSWECSYCGSLRPLTKYRCNNCGAVRVRKKFVNDLTGRN